MKATQYLKFAGAALGVAALLSGCMPTSLQAQRSALVNIAAGPGGPGTQQSSVVSDTYRTPGPPAVAVRTDRDAFVTVIVLPGGGAAQVMPEVPVKAGLTYEVGVPAFNGDRQVFSLASLSPLNLQGAQGVTTVKALGDAVAAATRSLPAGSYNVTTLEYTVAPFGRLTVNSNVSGAEVLLDGRSVGRTPYVSGLDVPVGNLDLEVKRPGFERWQGSVNVYENTDSNVYAHLRPAPRLGTVIVNSAVPADIYVQGQHVAQGQSASIRVRPGAVSVSVVPLPQAGKPALNSSGTTVQVRPGAVARVTCSGTTTFVCVGR